MTVEMLLKVTNPESLVHLEIDGESVGSVYSNYKPSELLANGQYNDAEVLDIRPYRGIGADLHNHIKATMIKED